MDIVARFQELYFGDRELLKLQIDSRRQTVGLLFNALDRNEQGAQVTLNTPSERLEPGWIEFYGCSRVLFPHGYDMNTTVVEYGVNPGAGSDTFEFWFTLIANDPQLWMRQIVVCAKDFRIHP